ncbi:MAG: LysR family transcriptional regulator [Hyphomicrobium sp.]|uniref:LysR family transcriptional regulator n=1 Tax=Hyphomicrobium sp. TaxID=82 RepID=UPI0039E70E2D
MLAAQKCFGRPSSGAARLRIQVAFEEDGSAVNVVACHEHLLRHPARHDIDNPKNEATEFRNEAKLIPMRRLREPVKFGQHCFKLRKSAVDKLQNMKVFAAVVELRGFSQAARSLGLSVPTVSRKIAELEDHLGSQLLMRTTRAVSTTDNGQRFYENVRKILDTVSEAESMASGESKTPKGRLAIAAPYCFGHRHILPIVNDFVGQYKEVAIRLQLSDVPVEMTEGRVDLGIRIEAPLDPAMRYLRLGTLRQIICASPAYLGKNGKPQTPRDLARHQSISFARSSGLEAPWEFRAGSVVQKRSMQSRLVMSTADAVVESAVAGHGLAQVYAYHASSAINRGRLEIVLENYEIAPVPVDIYYSSRRPTLRKVRVFLDYAIPRLKRELAEIARKCAI